MYVNSSVPSLGLNTEECSCWLVNTAFRIFVEYIYRMQSKDIEVIALSEVIVKAIPNVKRVLSCSQLLLLQ